MSYILDALKRADAERERGAAPGLHTRHQVPAGGRGTAQTTRNIGLLLAGSLVLVLLALFFWVVRAPDTLTPAPAAALAVMAPNAPAPAAPVLAAVPPAAITPMVPAPAPVVPAEAPKVQVLPQATLSAARPLAPPIAPADKAPTAVAVTAASTARPKAQASAAAAAPAAVALLAELPPDLRSQIPKITITGSVYSDSPAQRLLLINNLVLTQGSLVGADLTLEEIQPRSSVFIFKGTRFRVMH